MTSRGSLLIGALIGTLLGLAFPEAMAWLILIAVFAGALVWSAREMRPTPHRRRIVGSRVR